MAARLLRTVQGQVFRQQRARTDKAHLPRQHIEQLGQFIQGQGAHQPPRARQPPFVRQQFSPVILFIRHRLEFDDAEQLAVAAGPRLAEKRRSAVGGGQKRRQRQERNQQHRQHNQGGGKIQHPLDAITVNHADALP